MGQLEPGAVLVEGSETHTSSLKPKVYAFIQEISGVNRGTVGPRGNPRMKAPGALSLISASLYACTAVALYEGLPDCSGSLCAHSLSLLTSSSRSAPPRVWLSLCGHYRWPSRTLGLDASQVRALGGGIWLLSWAGRVLPQFGSSDSRGTVSGGRLPTSTPPVETLS